MIYTYQTNPEYLERSNEIVQAVVKPLDNCTIYEADVNVDPKVVNSIINFLSDFGFQQYVWSDQEQDLPPNNNRNIFNTLVVQDFNENSLKRHIMLLDNEYGNFVLIGKRDKPTHPNFLDTILHDKRYAICKDQYGRLWRPSFIHNTDEIQYGYYFLKGRWIFVELEEFIKLTFL